MNLQQVTTVGEELQYNPRLTKDEVNINSLYPTTFSWQVKKRGLCNCISLFTLILPTSFANMFLCAVMQESFKAIMASKCLPLLLALTEISLDKNLILWRDINFQPCYCSSYTHQILQLKWANFLTFETYLTVPTYALMTLECKCSNSCSMSAIEKRARREWL